jgi:hypothetical protein
MDLARKGKAEREDGIWHTYGSLSVDSQYVGAIIRSAPCFARDCAARGCARSQPVKGLALGWALACTSDAIIWERTYQESDSDIAPAEDIVVIGARMQILSRFPVRVRSWK